jgi:hypothetical protein
MPVPRATRTKPNRNTTMDFIPSKRDPRRRWLQNLADMIETEGPKAGMTPAEIAALKALAESHGAKMDATNAAQAALDGARETESQSDAIPQIRAAVRRLKTNPSYPGSGVEGTLQLRGGASSFDENTFKPELKVSVVGGQVKLDFTKGEADGVVVYARVRGTTGWTKLGIDTAAPYYDTRPLPAGSTSETREYMVRAILDDIEIGVESDIVSIIVAA